MIDPEEKCFKNESAFSENAWKKLIYMKAKTILIILHWAIKSPMIKYCKDE